MRFWKCQSIGKLYYDIGCTYLFRLPLFSRILQREFKCSIFNYYTNLELSLCRIPNALLQKFITMFNQPKQCWNEPAFAILLLFAFWSYVSILISSTSVRPKPKLRSISAESIRAKLWPSPPNFREKMAIFTYFWPEIRPKVWFWPNLILGCFGRSLSWTRTMVPHFLTKNGKFLFVILIW